MSSEDSTMDDERIAARVNNYDSRDRSVSPGPRGRTNSTDISGVGGGFVDESGSYPTHLLIEFNDEDASTSSVTNQYVDITQPRLYSNTLSSTPLASETAPISPHLNWVATSELDQIPIRDTQPQPPHHAHPRGNRTRSSAHGTESSAGTSRNDTAPSMTTVDPADRNGNHEDRSTTPVANISPGNTPSHRSESTAEDGPHEGREPESPEPFSSYHPYNPQYGRAVLDGFENILH